MSRIRQGETERARYWRLVLRESWQHYGRSGQPVGRTAGFHYGPAFCHPPAASVCPCPLSTRQPRKGDFCHGLLGACGRLRLRDDAQLAQLVRELAIETREEAAVPVSTDLV